jgi:Mg-chelatase subunit ChlD
MARAISSIIYGILLLFSASIGLAVGENAVGIPIVIHFHSTFSDGEKRPEEIKWGLEGDGVKAIIITDHASGASGIGSKTQEINKIKRNKKNDHYGFQNYIDTVTSLSSPSFLMVPGVELSCFWDKSGTGRESHLLLLDCSDSELRKDLFTQNEIEGDPKSGEGKLVKIDDLKYILKRANDLRIPTIAAHPLNPDIPFKYNPPTSPDQMPRLMEFFNTGVIDYNLNIYDWLTMEGKEYNLYMSFLEKGYDIGIASGSDFHTDTLNGLQNKGAGNTDQWHRYTYVCGLTGTPSRKQLLEALYNGQTISAVEDAAVESITYQPGFDIKTVHQITLDARLRRGRIVKKVIDGKEKTSSDKVYLLRVGTVKPIKTWNWPAELKMIDISFTDHDAKPGNTYTYVLYVPGQLITSPIKMRLVTELGKGASIREWGGGHTPGHPGVGFSEMPSEEVASKGPIDLIFCIDATGSMTDDIDHVKADASNLISRLRAKCSSLRIGLVTYRDFEVDGPRHLETNLPLTEDVDAILAAIQGITTTGGGDEPEDVLDGLQAAIDMSWRNGVAKFIILMGDAPAKDPDHAGKTKEMIAEAAFNVDPAHIYGLVLGDGGIVSKTALASFEAITELTGGKVYTVNNASELSRAIESTVTAAMTEHPNEVGGLLISSPDWQTPLFISSLVGIFVLGMVCIAVVALRRRRLPEVGEESTILAWLQVHSPDIAPYNAPITLPLWTIGRSSDNHLVLPDSRVSSHHAEVRIIDSTTSLVDKESSNGTQVNGWPVQKCILTNGDRVRVGDTIIIYFE